MRKLYFLLCFVAFSLWCFAEDSEKRVALIIGNQDYSGTGYNNLSNPVNDATGMAETLKQMGFTISGGKALINASQDQMLDAIDKFSNDSYEAAIAIFYYSGHGVAYGQDNLMLPVGKKINDFYAERCVSLNTVRDKMEESDARLNIIILDACRSALRNGVKGGESMNNGLLRTEIPEGFLYCYATSKNKEAIDRPNGKYSYFTEALITQMKKDPNQKFGDMYQKVKNQVLNATNNRQRPTINNEDLTNFTLDFFLSPQSKITLSPVDEIKPAPTRGQINTIVSVDKTTLEANRDNPKIREVVFESGTIKFVPRDYKGEFIIGNDITVIGKSAFFKCSGLTSVTIPNSVTSIGGFAFCGCSGLKSVTIPNSVTSIGNSAFKGCTGLTSVTIPNSVASYGYAAFQGCSSISKPLYNNWIFVFLPRSYKGTYAIPDGILIIDEYAFAGCIELTDIIIPNSVTSIGNGAFKGCTGLTSVTIPNSVTSIGYWAFTDCSGLTSVTIPNSVTSIGSGVFSGCSGLTSVTIPNSVMSIGGWAFENCSGLTSVTIPNSVTSIGQYAFYGCSGLTSVIIMNAEIKFYASPFSECSSLQSIYVPKGAKEYIQEQLPKGQQHLVKER